MNSNYASFDFPLLFSTAKSDPVAFIKSLPRDRLNIIDEVQMVPEIFRPLKISIDTSRQNGTTAGPYLLTGSANILALPALAEALTGRMSILTLLPLSSAEYHRTGNNFIEKLWSEKFSHRRYEDIDLVDTIVGATYPEIALNKGNDKTQWLGDYLTTVLQRDVKAIADIRNPGKIIQLLVALSQRVGSLLNDTAVIKDANLDAKTYNKYKALVKNTFLTFEVEPWSKPNRLNKKFVKQKKLYFYDTNLLCLIMRRSIGEVYERDPVVMGHLFENFIATEIMKNMSSIIGIEVSHFNISGGKEVDFVLERHNGEAVGIEVKLDSTLSTKDFANMKILQDTIGIRFKRGIIIYPGNEMVPFSENIWAVPVNYLWE
jgi:predicted AAA+ superfamily ATPase